MLTLYRTLHEMQVPPLSTSDGWARCTSPPPFTDLPGQVGVYQESWPGEWLSLCSDISITDLPTLYFSEDGGSERVIVTPLIVEPDGWLTYELPSGFVSIVSWESRLPFNPVVWQDIVEQWTRRPGPLSEQVELESISLCYYVDFWIDVKRETDLLDHDHVYYHRCPVACTDPRSFWGYLSTNKDPQAWNDNLENMGWKLRYGVEMHMWKLVDDWGYKYRKLLAESLRSMPGSFPTEAAETDLDEE
ncbi:hypothetical protein FRC09_008260 [Ceratobasidium sp. 395]|nr:hypothetical protein FRC09_008260 [Ceratobasidium sp. 395]